MMHAVEFQEMECATFGCETGGKTCMDEKVIRFRKQNVANSISYMHGICSLYLFSRTFFPQWRHLLYMHMFFGVSPNFEVN